MKVRHLRAEGGTFKPGLGRGKRKGATVVTVTRHDKGGFPEATYEAYAFCSKRDNYAKKTGRRIAAARVLHLLPAYDQQALFPTLTLL